jgi:hypothetical protein
MTTTQIVYHAPHTTAPYRQWAQAKIAAMYPSVRVTVLASAGEDWSNAEFYNEAQQVIMFLHDLARRAPRV